MLNSDDFKKFPNQSCETKMFILKMEITVLLEQNLLSLDKLIKKYDDPEMHSQIEITLSEVKKIIELIEYAEKKD